MLIRWEWCEEISYEKGMRGRYEMYEGFMVKGIDIVRKIEEVGFSEWNEE